MIGDSQFIIKVRDVLTDLRSCNLLFDMDSLEHELFSTIIFLLLSKLDCDSFHHSLLPGLFNKTCFRFRASFPAIHDNARVFGFYGKGLRDFAANGHTATVNTATVTTVHHLETLIENCLSLCFLVTFLVAFRKVHLQLKHRIVIFSV